MNAVGYCRVSSTDQVDGTSLDNQRAQIEAYCVMKGISLVGILTDAAVSGGKPLAERPAGREMVEALNTGQAEVVIITKLDRGFRNTVDCLSTVASWKAKGIALHILDLGGSSVDTTSAAGEFMLSVLAAAAQMERRRIAERCNEGRQARKAIGGRIGEVPFGWTVDDDNLLVEHPEEQEALRLIHSMHRDGHSFRSIADELIQRGIPTKKGGKWSHKQIQGVLKRAA